jgi:hypothetical protein
LFSYGENMTTLIIEGLDKNLTAQLEMEAHKFNLSVNELAKRLIHKALNPKPSEEIPSIDSIFGLVPSKTDGLQFQNAMREE